MKIKVFTNSLFFIVIYGHLNTKIVSFDQFCVNIDGITSKLEYYCQKLILHPIFWLVLGNEDKIMICPFFKFSALEHFCGPKLISWVDIWVVLIWYSFQSVWVNLEGEFEKWTKCTRKMDKMQKGETWGCKGARREKIIYWGVQQWQDSRRCVIFLINKFKICWSAPSRNKLFLQ